MLLFEDPATTSKIPALERPAFAKVAAAAHPGDVLTVSELFRLCRDLVDIHAVRDWCQARGVALRVLSGPLSNLHDLAAGDATTALLINVITAVGQFQRDLQNELTAEGIAAAEAEGRYRGRPPALDDARRQEARDAFQDQGASIAALARTHGVSRAAVRTALADLLPDQPAEPGDSGLSPGPPFPGRNVAPLERPSGWSSSATAACCDSWPCCGYGAPCPPRRVRPGRGRTSWSRRPSAGACPGRVRLPCPWPPFRESGP